MLRQRCEILSSTKYENTLGHLRDGSDNGSNEDSLYNGNDDGDNDNGGGDIENYNS